MKTKRKPSLIVLATILLASPALRADTVELKAGGILRGKYAGGTATTVRLDTGNGVEAIPTADILALTFTAAGATAAPEPPPAPVVVVVPAAATAPLSVPAGTVLTVRMDTQVSSKDASGKKFSGKLVADLMSGNVVVARAGTTVLGQVEQAKQAGRLAGKSTLQLTLTGVDLGGRIAPILTTTFADTGKSSFRKTARNAGVGAIVGNQFDSNGGAGKGAAVGVGVSLIREGDSVTVPPGAILEFRLTQPLTVTP
jgi:hypothetical protein